MSAALEVKDLHVEVDARFASARKVLKGLSFTIERGETLGLVGETGSGKSVAILAVMGLLDGIGRSVEGEVSFGGRTLASLSSEELERLRGREVSVIMQNARSALDPLARVGAQIADAYRSHYGVSRKEAAAKALEMIRRVQLPDADRVARARVDELSGGMAQRVAIATALVCAPSLLLADDPTSGLDVTVQAQILELMSDLARTEGLSTLLVTRDLGIVAHYCDRVAVIFDGQVVESALVGSFFSDPQHPHSRKLLQAAAFITGRNGGTEKQLRQ